MRNTLLVFESSRRLLFKRNVRCSRLQHRAEFPILPCCGGFNNCWKKQNGGGGRKGVQLVCLLCSRVLSCGLNRLVSLKQTHIFMQTTGSGHHPHLMSIKHISSGDIPNSIRRSSCRTSWNPRGTLVKPQWNLTSGPPRTTPEPIWAETPKLSAVGK